MPDQPPRQHLGHLGFEQLGVRRHQRAGQVGQEMVDPAVPAQVLDHRVQPAELLAELRVQRPVRRRPAFGPDTDTAAAWAEAVADTGVQWGPANVAPAGELSDAVTSISSRVPRPNSRRRRTSRVPRMTASPPRSRRTCARASFIVPAR